MWQTLIFIGNLGREPEMRYMPNGQPVTTLSVATNRQYTNANGESVKETTWFKVSVFGKQAESCNTYLHKGSKVLVEGRLQPDPASGGPRIWKRQDGSSGASFDVAASTVRFLTPKGEGGEGGAAEETGAHSVSEDEIPF